jgi:hypothetical protein
MVIMALSDMLCLPVTTFISGYFSLTGQMFCDAPILIYTAGIFGFGKTENIKFDGLKSKTNLLLNEFLMQKYQL